MARCIEQVEAELKEATALRERWQGMVNRGEEMIAAGGHDNLMAYIEMYKAKIERQEPLIKQLSEDLESLRGETERLQPKAIQCIVKNKYQGGSMEEFLYGEDEDKNAARAYGIASNNDMIGAYGGLKALYDQIRDRKIARETVNESTGKLYEVFELPQTPEQAMELIPIGLPAGMKVREKDQYETLVRQQQEKVAGIMGAIANNRAFKEYQEREAKQKADVIKMREMKARGETRPW